MTDHKNTVFLPETPFPMRANLPQKEPEILRLWQEMGLDALLLEQNSGKEKFILHDGPPYANGNIHIGHALNKVLKDVIIRHNRMLGKHAPYVPGWDCHGLPIEWKLEEEYRKAKKDKDADPVAFRQACRDYAQKWMGIQSEEFQRLGVSGDWQNPYNTMDFRAEAAIVRELHKFLQNGLLYQGFKPVLWSVVEQTALAEAEVEYQDKESTQVYVRFPVISSPVKELEGASIVIWTTTPWTLPSNAAVACNPELEYAVIEVKAVNEGSLAVVGERLVVAVELIEAFSQAVGILESQTFGRIKGADILGDAFPAYPKTPKWVPAFSHVTRCQHTLPYAQTDELERLVLSGDFVTADQGTGFVHIAPEHGEDDYRVYNLNCILYAKDYINNWKIPFPRSVQKNGIYASSVSDFAGQFIFKPETTQNIIQKLKVEGRLLSFSTFIHSYPHSWRSKAPLIYYATPQWFISLSQTPSLRGTKQSMGTDVQVDCFADARNDGEAGTLRETALQELEKLGFYPPQGQNRLRSMIENRPDWCVSRQRVWGVPLMFLVDKNGQPLKDPAILERITQRVSTEGCDWWFAPDVVETLLKGTSYNPANYDKVTDILDVWFDSGSTHAFVLEDPDRPELHKPDGQRSADLYLEGSDQHRGWFQASLLESCGTRGRAPFDAVLTHGFVLDEQSRKMSKSLGNVVAPQDVMDKYGADILRLWVVSSDYYNDLRIGPAILEHQADIYRRLRNTLRYLLGNLHGFTDAESVTNPAEMPELEQYILHRLSELDAQVRETQKTYAFHGLMNALHHFCTVDLSAFYFDIRKDCLYCDDPASLKRRSARTVMKHLLDCLTAWLAPVLCFTAEEVWQLIRKPDQPMSIHLCPIPDVPATWRNATLATRWFTLKGIRRVVLSALEKERAEKRIGSSLQSCPVVYLEKNYPFNLRDTDLAEICITSGITVTMVDVLPDGAFRLPDEAGIAVLPTPATGEKCSRCWKVLESVGKQPLDSTLCDRCADVVAGQGQPA